jgi:hypothetical protein
MTDRLSRLAESRIRKAEAEGQFQNLPGAGKPLPDRPGDAFTDPGDALGYRIMAEAGAIPEEFRLKAAAAALRAQLAATTDPAARKALMADLAQAEMKQAIAEEARRKFMR